VNEEKFVIPGAAKQKVFEIVHLQSLPEAFICRKAIFSINTEG